MTKAGADERRTDTREQIRAIALELFAEQGYEKTSLREIAERLGVTKAAVYYHYRTKEEILASLLDKQLAGMDAIVEWGSSLPPGPQRRRDVLERYSTLLAGTSETGRQLVRFLQESQTQIKELAAGARMRERFARLAALLTEPGDPPAVQLRARLALIALHLGAFAHTELGGDPVQSREAALEVALELGVGPGVV
jgi:AcrR family transcriptional regulator